MTTDAAAAERPPRWGLAAKLFAVLALLGASAVVVTGVLGYINARDSLEETIYHQLSAARQTKARQVESYFRGTRNDLRLLASTKMAIDATRDFRSAFDELEHKEFPADLKSKVDAWYAANYLPDIRRQLGTDAALADFLPNGPAANDLQYRYIVTNPYPSAQRRLLDDAGDGSAYSAAHAIYHPLLRNAATIEGFADFLLADTKSGRLIYGMAKEEDFATSLRIGPYRDSKLAAAVARCAGRPARRLHGRTRHRSGRGDRRADRPALDRGDRPGGDRREALASGRLRRHRRDLSGRARFPDPVGRTPVL